MRNWHGPWIVSVILVAILVAGSLPVSADPSVSSAMPCSPIRLVVSNPQPGDVLSPGAYVVQGEAADTTTVSAPGIDRVQVFAEQSREAGGQLIGEVVPAQTDIRQHLNARGFAVTASIPDTMAANDTHQLFVYARSQQSGAEQVLAITYQLRKPLSVGQFTPTPSPPPSQLALQPCGTPTPTPTFPPFPAATPVSTAQPSLSLSVANPQPSASLSNGMYVIEGQAFDAQAQGSSGVDRVQVFLDPRDTGGQFLGDADLGTNGPFGFRVLATLPNRKGDHIITVYAHSSVTDREISVPVPVSID